MQRADIMYKWVLHFLSTALLSPSLTQHKRWPRAQSQLSILRTNQVSSVVGRMLGTLTGSKFRRFKGHPRRDGSKLAIDDDRRSPEDTEGSAAWNRLRAATRILYDWWRPTTARRRLPQDGRRITSGS
ncbi:hypothetical protein BDP67DRAFT_84872 [Colletotrichum lupini]|nr:hypothetical protein BDP67DRAFT_84872 [Colletotrichum lupini]